ncbi:MAG: nonstructural protein [Microviridae sp.]|nr:MAG: nonstructural protein [Microviridae sp.]
MQKGSYSVYDSKAQIFGNPFFSTNDQTALRDLSTAAADRNSTIGRNPTDFTLYRIGAFDDFSGKILPIDPFINLGMAAQFLNLEV